MRYIEHLKTVDRETCLVSLSDKVHNARSILRDLRNPEIGSAVWSRFGKRPKEDTLWYSGSWQMPFKACCQANLPKS
jgi:hypothetical protein